MEWERRIKHPLLCSIRGFTHSNLPLFSGVELHRPKQTFRMDYFKNQEYQDMMPSTSTPLPLHRGCMQAVASEEPSCFRVSTVLAIVPIVLPMSVTFGKNGGVLLKHSL